MNGGATGDSANPVLAVIMNLNTPTGCWSLWRCCVYRSRPQRWRPCLMWIARLSRARCTRSGRFSPVVGSRPRTATGCGRWKTCSPMRTTTRLPCVLTAPKSRSDAPGHRVRVGAHSSRARRNRTPSSSPKSPDPKDGTCGPGVSGPGGCMTRRPSKARASTGSCVIILMSTWRWTTVIAVWPEIIPIKSPVHHQVTCPPKKPGKDATDAQIEASREARHAQSSSRICVEHGIGELKAWRTLQRWIGRRDYLPETIAAIVGLVSDRALATG